MSNNNDETNVLEETLNVVFSETIVTILLWVLAIYFILNSIIAVSRSDGKNFRTKVANATIIVIIFAIVFGRYYDLTSEQRADYATYLNESLKEYLKNGWSMIELALLGAILYGLAYIVKFITNDSANPASLDALLMITMIGFVVMVTLFFIREILNIPIVDVLFGSFGSAVSVEDDDSDNNATASEEVFNVSNNLYTYDDAPYVCQALGARLANYDEVERSYENGGEWCNYGWSADQMALFPTQKETWNRLQTNEDYKHACGRPGVNGGFIANPNIRYGVNCYGVKPTPTPTEEEMMESNVDIPRSRAQEQLERRVQFWKDNAAQLMNINSFNKDKWSRY
jgi:hypothetical protein